MKAGLDSSGSAMESEMRARQDGFVAKPVYITKDSGERRDFPTGSRRDTRKGKGRYDLLSPLALARVAGILERGAQKYGDRNWERGQPLSGYIDSGLRHAFQYLEGRQDEDHLGQAAWNLLAAIHTEEAIRRGLLPPDLADLPSFMPSTEKAKEMYAAQTNLKSPEMAKKMPSAKTSLGSPETAKEMPRSKTNLKSPGSPKEIPGGKTKDQVRAEWGAACDVIAGVAVVPNDFEPDEEPFA